MNKVRLLTILILLVYSSCFTEIERKYLTTATVFLINETSVVIKSDDTLGYVIQPGETIIYTESNTLDGDRPSINEYFLSFLYNKNVFRYEDNELKCEPKIFSIEYYENKKELKQDGDTLIFEFTFRFTEEKKADAKICN